MCNYEDKCSCEASGGLNKNTPDDEAYVAY